MIIYGKPFTKKQIKEMLSEDLLGNFQETIEMLYEKPYHKGARRDKQQIESEILRRMKSD